MTPADGQASWTKPPQGQLKVNVDAALFRETNSFSFVGVARDHLGAFVEVFSVCRLGLVSPELAEVMGIREALSWIKRKNWRNIVVETDSLLVVQALRSNLELDSYFGCLIQECKILLRDSISVSVVFVKRTANGTAHALARESTMVAVRSLFKEDLSSSFWTVLLRDI
ncbi:uncharacterized protein LOC133818639 [Humulus lupulus]|uniref:uncharacterized protein LOC133818639 n=1 Tax=Humulus lupulus TaxID=3486 RepID=UPI002B41201C|nr:uncharacterized protein LOC133818639 [Humulus lupulus]